MLGISHGVIRDFATTGLFRQKHPDIPVLTDRVLSQPFANPLVQQKIDSPSPAPTTL